MVRYSIRKLTTNNKTGDAHGITIPRELALQYKETRFYVQAVGHNILLKSGAEIQIDIEDD